MSCHMCWTEYYRLCKVKSRQERNRRAAFKIRIQVLMGLGLMYGQAVWQATWEEVDAKNDT